MEWWRSQGVRAVERIDDGAEADERVLDHLSKLGGDPASPRATTHFLYLSEQVGADAVSRALDRDGWETNVEECDDHSWLVVATSMRTLTSEHVRSTRRLLESLASKHGGVYDGWEARAN
jgi:hypothetical protein